MYQFNFQLFQRIRSSASILAIALAAAGAAPADAEEARISLNIRAQSLSSALFEFGNQSGIAIGFAEALTEGLTGPVVNGEYTVEEALNLILKGSGLKYEFIDEHSIRITRKPSPEAFDAKTDDLLNNLFEEIVVTATKRPESMQDVPISISAFGETQLAAVRPNSLRDISNLVPNMLMQPPVVSNENNISIRGLSNNFAARSSGRSVGVYVDGVYVGTNTAVNVDMADVERVEVLKGPQGTLFGRDTIGGAINITTKRPSNEFQGNVGLEVGNFDLVKVKAGADIPLVEDILAIRVSGQHITAEGHITNEFNGKDFNNQDASTARLQFFYTPTANWDLRLAYIHGENNSRPSHGEPVTNAYSDHRPYTVNLDADQVQRQNYDSLSLTTEYEFTSGHILTSVTGWSDTEDYYRQDSDFTPLQIEVEEFLGHSKEWSQELRITSPASTKYDYLAGIYYFHTDNRLADIYPVMGPAFLLTLGFPPEAIPPVDILDGQQRDFSTDSLAFFTHANYHFTDRLTFFGGVRYTADEKAVDYSIFGETSAVLGFSNGNFKTKTKDEPFSWTLGLRYAISDNAMTYASAARGYRSSAIKDYFVTAEDLAIADGLVTEPEFVTNYEVGLKLRAFEGMLQLNAAAFLMDYTDIQVAINLPPYLWIRKLTNAAAATIEGGELELTVRPTPNLQISATAGYLSSQYDEFQADPTTDYSGEELGYSPEWSTSLSIDYNRSLGDSGVWLAHIDYGYKSEYGFGPASKDLEEAGGYGKVNAWTGYETSDESWRLTLWVNNLLDEDSNAGSNIWGAGLGPVIEHAVKIYEAPRTYGVTLGYNF